MMNKKHDLEKFIYVLNQIGYTIYMKGKGYIRTDIFSCSKVYKVQHSGHSYYL